MLVAGFGFWFMPLTHNPAWLLVSGYQSLFWVKPVNSVCLLVDRWFLLLIQGPCSRPGFQLLVPGPFFWFLLLVPDAPMTVSCLVQGGMHLCSAGWMAQARVGYPTTYVNPLCGFGHVGIVDYGARKNLSELWDVFCYRMKGESGKVRGPSANDQDLHILLLISEVKCECMPGYVGDGFSCTGNLLQVLEATPTFSNFLTVSLDYLLTLSSALVQLFSIMLSLCSKFLTTPQLMRKGSALWRVLRTWMSGPHCWYLITVACRRTR